MWGPLQSTTILTLNHVAENIQYLTLGAEHWGSGGKPPRQAQGRSVIVNAGLILADLVLAEVLSGTGTGCNNCLLNSRGALLSSRSIIHRKQQVPQNAHQRQGEAENGVTAVTSDMIPTSCPQLNTPTQKPFMLQEVEEVLGTQPCTQRQSCHVFFEASCCNSRGHKSRTRLRDWTELKTPLDRGRPEVTCTDGSDEALPLLLFLQYLLHSSGLVREPKYIKLSLSCSQSWLETLVESGFSLTTTSSICFSTTLLNHQYENYQIHTISTGLNPTTTFI